MAEWSIAAVLKTVEVSKPPGVRIPLSPPKFRKTDKNHRKLHVLGGFFLFLGWIGVIERKRSGEQFGDQLQPESFVHRIWVLYFDLQFFALGVLFNSY